MSDGDPIGQGHPERFSRCSSRAIESIGAESIARLVTQSQEHGEIVPGVGRPRPRAHFLVDLDGGGQVSLGIIETVERRGQQAKVPVHCTHAPLRMTDRMAPGEGLELRIQHSGRRRVAEQGACFAGQADLEQPFAVAVEHREFVASDLPECLARLRLTTDVDQHARQRRPMDRIPREVIDRSPDDRQFLPDPTLFATKQEPLHATCRLVVTRRRHPARREHLGDQRLGQRVVAFDQGQEGAWRDAEPQLRRLAQLLGQTHDHVHLATSLEHPAGLAEIHEQHQMRIDQPLTVAEPLDDREHLRRDRVALDRDSQATRSPSTALPARS